MSSPYRKPRAVHLAVFALVAASGALAGALIPTADDTPHSSVVSIPAQPTTATTMTYPLQQGDELLPWDARTADWSKVLSFAKPPDSAKTEPVVGPDKDGCWRTSQPLLTPSKKAPTIPPPPSTRPEHPEPLATTQTGRTCGAGSLRWRFRTGDVVSASPAFWRDLVFIGSRDGTLYALEQSTGKVRWRRDNGTAVDVRPAVDGDVLYYGTGGGELFAVNAETGATLWSYSDLKKPYQSSPLVVGDVLYAGGAGNRVRALEKRTGKLLWMYETELWVQSSVAFSNNRIFVGSDDGYLHVIDAATGEGVRKVPVSRSETAEVVDPSEKDLSITPDGHRSNVMGTPALAGGVAYATNLDGLTWAFDERTFKPLWSFHGEVTVTDPIVYGDSLLLHSNSSVLRAVDRTTGRVRWGARTGTALFFWAGPYQNASAPVVTGNTVIVGGSDGDIVAFDVRDGEFQWSFRTGDWVLSNPQVRGDTVFVGSNDGWVYAIATK